MANHPLVAGAAGAPVAISATGLADTTRSSAAPTRRVAIIGAGPAGLMAAERLAAAGVQVDVYDGMATPGRKFLLAGRGGLNLTHSEPAAGFRTRYGERTEMVGEWLDHFDADALRAWVQGLGVETFVGSSGRVFPVGMKAAPLLRAWLDRLHGSGVRFHMRHRWLGWPAELFEGDDRANASAYLRFDTANGEIAVQADAVVLALGGASWRRLGSDGAWVPWLVSAGMEVAALRPANCGFDVAGRPAIEATVETRRSFLRELVGAESADPVVGWSAYFSERFAGKPLKSIALHFDDGHGHRFQRRGECVVTATGLEGNLVYAASAGLRDAIERHGTATLHLDLLPDWTAERVRTEVTHPRGARSLSTHLKSRLGIDGVKAGLLHELLDKAEMADPALLAARIKALPLTMLAPRPIDEAISTAGGVAFGALDAGLMSKAVPGVFIAGEMLDWEAPTGGYLINACMASGWVAGDSASTFARNTADGVEVDPSL